MDIYMKLPLEMKFPTKPDDLRLVMLRPEDIRPNPYQPRREFDKDALDMLAASIRENGILQPLSVRKENGGYELIAGERRLRAAMEVGLPRVPCVVSRVSDEGSSVLALVENLQRSNLNFFEEADAMGRLMVCHNMTQEEIAGRLGKSQPAVANKLRLLKLSPEMRGRILSARLTERHARCLLRLPDEEAEKALDQIIARGLNVAEADRLVERMLGGQGKKPKKTRRQMGAVRDLRLFCNTLDKAVKSIRGTGLPVEARREDQDGFVEYVIRLPKSL